MGKSNPRNPRTLIPNERWWFPILATNWYRLIFNEHQSETLNRKIQQKNFCGPIHLLFSATINPEREIHLEFCKKKKEICHFLCSTLDNCKTAKYFIYMYTNKCLVMNNDNLRFKFSHPWEKIPKLEILWAMLTKWYPPLPHVLYNKVLVLLWETPKSCR